MVADCGREWHMIIWKDDNVLVHGRGRLGQGNCAKAGGFTAATC